MGACTSTGEQKYKMDGDIVGRGGISSSRAPMDGYKLVLLGMPRSGKTTLHQQMKCVFGNGFSVEETTLARTRIIAYIINIARALVWHADRRRLDTPSMTLAVRRAIVRLTGNEPILTHDIVEHLRTLWAEPAIQGLYHQRAVLYAEVGDTHVHGIIPDSTAYFFNKLSLLAKTDYQLTNEDILRCPLSNTLLTTNSTTGSDTSSSRRGHPSSSSSSSSSSTCASDPIRNLDLRLAPKTTLPKSLGVPRFRVIDAGGATHSRMQWLQCIDNVHAVLFVAALSHYDHILPSPNASPLPITASTTTMVEPIVQSASSTTSSTAVTSSHKSPPASFFAPPQSHRYELTESLNLFEDVCRSPWFTGAHIILILTKSDLLKDKCSTSPLRNTCPDYIGNDDYTSYVDFIRRQYLGRASLGYRARHAAASTPPSTPPASSLGATGSTVNGTHGSTSAITGAPSSAAAVASSAATPVSPVVAAAVASSHNNNGHHNGVNGSAAMPEIFTHIVNAADTDGVRTVFDSIKLTIIGINIPAKLE